MRRIGTKVIAAALLAFVAGGASAIPQNIIVDKMVWDPSIADPSQLSGLVTMELDGQELTITLTNTSADAAGSGAGILLTGIGFNLPTGVSITGGSVSAPDGFVNFISLSQDASGEWGYDNRPLQSGALKSLLVGADSVNTVASSMSSQTETPFSAIGLDSGSGLAGPDWGIISAAETNGLGNGNEAIRGSATIQLNLSSVYAGDLIGFINGGIVALSFGSASVPEPSSLALLGISVLMLAGVAVYRRPKRPSA